MLSNKWESAFIGSWRIRERADSINFGEMEREPGSQVRAVKGERDAKVLESAVQTVGTLMKMTEGESQGPQWASVTSET